MHIMFDLETLSTKDNPAVVQIGAVSFDPFAYEVLDVFGLEPEVGGKIYSEFLATVRLGSHDLGLIDGDTLGWWLKQPAMRDVLVTEGMTLFIALQQFSTWVRAQGTLEGVWCNGASFDFRVLRQTYERMHKTYPFKFRDERDYRTLKNLFPNVPPPTFAGQPHNALDDSRFQARHAISILRAIRDHQRP